MINQNLQEIIIFMPSISLFDIINVFTSVNGFDWCLFQLIVLLKPDFNCYISLALSWVGRIITQT